MATVGIAAHPAVSCEDRVLRSRPTSSSTPRGREAGEIPAQSRYGDHPNRSDGSPVADPTVHARTFERKVGRTVTPIT